MTDIANIVTRKPNSLNSKTLLELRQLIIFCSLLLAYTHTQSPQSLITFRYLKFTVSRKF